VARPTARRRYCAIGLGPGDRPLRPYGNLLLNRSNLFTYFALLAAFSDDAGSSNG
jgi:hypothetical protein